VRGRFGTAAILALGSLATSAAGIAVSLVTSDKWPGWLEPYRPWGWWAVLGLTVAAALVAVWQALHQPATSSDGTQTITADSGGLAVGQNATAVSGGLGPTAGRDVNVTNIAVPPLTVAMTGLVMRTIVVRAADGTETRTLEIYSEEVAQQRIRQDSLEFEPQPEADEGDGG
jgi:hypothetical protein